MNEWLKRFALNITALHTAAGTITIGSAPYAKKIFHYQLAYLHVVMSLENTF